MASASGYSHFIHGKVIGEGSYRIVAHTADLGGQEALMQTVAKNYRFWGNQPAAGSTPRASGIFWYADWGCYILVQAERAMTADGQPMMELGTTGRWFTQHRYVMIPPESIAWLHGRLWLLFPWTFGQRIPLITAFKPTLEPLVPPTAQTVPVDQTRELAQLHNAMQVVRDGESVLLHTLSTLLHDRHPRLLIDHGDRPSIASEALLASLLLLLPQSIRQRCSLAYGTIDEKVCAWAQFLITTDTLQFPLSEDLRWFKRSSNQLVGGVSNNAMLHPYVSRIRPAVSDSAHCARLLGILDTVDAGSVWHNVARNWGLRLALTRLAASEEARRTALVALLRECSSAQWSEAIRFLCDSVELTVAGHELLATGAPSGSKATACIQLFDRWEYCDPSGLTQFLGLIIPAHTELAEHLLDADLVPRFAHGSDDIDRHGALLAICASVIRSIVCRQANAGVALVERIGHHYPLTAKEQFTLLATPLANRTQRFEQARTYFNTHLAHLLPTIDLPTLAASCVDVYWQAVDPAVVDLLRHVVVAQVAATADLPRLAAATGMSYQERSALYAAALTAWDPPLSDARHMVIDLLTSYDPVSTDLADAIVCWFAHTLPTDALAALTDARSSINIVHWRALATALCDIPLQRLNLLDTIALHVPIEALLADWLQEISSQPALWPAFRKSQTWQIVIHDRRTWLGSIVRVLAGERTPPGTNDLRIWAHDLQQLIDLSPHQLYELCEQIPQQAASGPLSVDALMSLLGICIQAGAEIRAESSNLLHQIQLQVGSDVITAVFRDLQSHASGQEAIHRALEDLPACAGALVHWVVVHKRYDRIPGVLMQTLAAIWLHQGYSDSSTMNLLIQPTMTEQYDLCDWRVLIAVSWLPGNEPIQLLGKLPALDDISQRWLAAQACEIVQLYTSPAQTRRLLRQCTVWGLGRVAEVSILQATRPDACGVDLVADYLQHESAAEPAVDMEGLFELLVHQVPSSDLERRRLIQLVTHHMKRQMKHHDVTRIQRWKAMSADKTVYRQAFASAAQSWIDTQLVEIRTYATLLQRSQMPEEHETFTQYVQRCLDKA